MTRAMVTPRKRYAALAITSPVCRWPQRRRCAPLRPTEAFTVASHKSHRAQAATGSFCGDVVALPRPRSRREASDDVQAASLQLLKSLRSANGGLSSLQDCVVAAHNVEDETADSFEGPEPDKHQLVGVMTELVNLYATPDVQRELHEIRVQAVQTCDGNEGVGDFLTEAMQRLLLPRQVEIMRRHCLAPSPGGLRKFQNAVRRRVCSGDLQIRHLANIALELLGLPGVEHMVSDLDAEHFMQVIREQHVGSSMCDVKEMLLDFGGDDMADALAVLEDLCRQYRPRGSVNLGLLRTWGNWEVIDQPRKFGAFHEAIPPVTRLIRPTTSEVFAHVMQHRPVVISGAFDSASSFPPLRDFQDFNYLRCRCGDRLVSVKGDSTYDHKGRLIFFNDPSVRLTMSDYLDMIEEAEHDGSSVPFYMGKIPLSQEVPELVEDIDDAPASPWKKFGSCFGPLTVKGVHMYFGCGRNTSAIHWDPSENLLVVVSGSKTYELYPPCDAELLYPSVKKSMHSGVPPCTKPDEMPVDLQARFPLYTRARPLRVDLEAGDMLYLPRCWWHGVTGSVGRNMTLVWWSESHPKKRSYFQETDGAQWLLSHMAQRSTELSQEDVSESEC